MAEDFEVTGELPEDDENRTFVIAAAGLGGLIVLSLVCLGVYALILQPQQREAALREPTSIVLTNTAVALALTQTEEAADFTPVPTEAPPTLTPSPTVTNTPVPTQVVVLPTDTPTATPFTTLPTLAPLTATAAAQMTQTAEAIAGGAGSPTPTATALPSTGFGDDVGLPGLAGLAALFLVAIFLSRRLRSRATPAG
jgi:LPXTG-motif cell wall-anchored protein